MAEPAPASSPVPPPAAEEVAADSALWRQIYLTHLSHLRGHLKFLVGLSTTPAAKGKLEKRSYILLLLISNTNKTTEIATAKKAINDAKAAAVIAGLVRPTTTTEVAPKRKTRPSVTFAEHPEVLGPKKAKTGHARAGAGRGKPSAEMLGRLRSRLGKHGAEVEEGVVEKVVKKGRLAYLQEGDPEGEYLDDEEMGAGLEEGEGEAETTTDTPSASVSGSKRGKTTTEPSAKKARTTASVPSVFANPAVTPSASSKRAKTSSTASPSSVPTTTTTETPAASSSSAKKTKTDTTPAKDKSAPTTTTTTPSAPKNTDATTPSTSDTAKKTKTKTPSTRGASKSAKAKQSHARSPKHAVVVDGAGDVGSREAKKQKKEHYEFVGGRWSRYEGYE